MSSSAEVRIGSFELAIPGPTVRKKYDEVADVTVFTITGEQAAAMHEALSKVVEFFNLTLPPAAGE